jgi:hypothetical protein
MAIVKVYPTLMRDVWAFENMRPADAAEVMASGGYSPVEAIIDSWAHSKETWTASINGEVAAMFGVAHHPVGTELAPVSVGWLLTTPVVDKHPIAFYKECKKRLADMFDRYGVIFNYVDTRHTRALEWAKRLGFIVHEPVKFGKHGEPFRMIVYGG